MTTIQVVRDVYDALGNLIPTQPVLIDSSQLAAYQAAGYRQPFGAPAAPNLNSQYPGFTMSPTDVQPWTFNWGDSYLVAGESITQSLWLPSSPISLTSPGVSGGITSVTVSGPTGGITYYLITNRVTTSTGRQRDWSFQVIISQE